MGCGLGLELGLGLGLVWMGGLGLGLCRIGCRIKKYCLFAETSHIVLFFGNIFRILPV